MCVIKTMTFIVGITGAMMIWGATDALTYGSLGLKPGAIQMAIGFALITIAVIVNKVIR